MFKLFIMLIFLLSCSSSINVRYDFDSERNYSVLHTYDWSPNPRLILAGFQSNEKFTFVDNKIKSLVNSSLITKGFEQDSQNPDFFIVYILGTIDKIDESEMEYSVGKQTHYLSWGGTFTELKDYDKGTLIIDFVDAKTKELIWRGAATKSVAENPTQKTIEKNLEKAISQLMENFPPHKY
jgi:hypothetical protein